jgi:hypothetical protein
MKRAIRLSFICSVAISLFNCSSFKGSAALHAQQYYSTFFVNDSTTQYFIKPVEYTKEKLQVSIDYTFRKVNDGFSEVTTNFTLSDSKLAQLESLYIKTDTNKIIPGNVNELYRKRTKNIYIYRFTSKIEFKDLQNIFKSSTTNISVNGSKLFPNGKSSKKIANIQSKLFDFELAITKKMMVEENK